MDARKRAAANYYKALLPPVLPLLWRGVNLVLTIVAVVIAYFLYDNRQDLALKYSVPDWTWLVPIALVLIGGLLMVNYDRFAAEKSRADLAEGELGVLKGSLEHMVFVSGFVVAIVQAKGSTEQGIQIGLAVQNASAVPMRFECRTLRVAVAGRTLTAPEFKNRGAVIPPFRGTEYWFPTIPGIPKTFPLAGLVEYELAYGPALGALIYTTSDAADLTLAEQEPLKRTVSIVWTYRGPSR